MRILRSLVAVAALAALAPRAGHAQNGREFNNSWFWGAKGGVMQFWTTDVAHAPAPLIGAEWLITRQRAALYLAYDQSFFDQTSTYTAYDYPNLEGARPVVGEGRARIQDMRRFTAQIMVFPKRFGIMRPYAGLGFALNDIANATETGTNPGGDTEFSINDAQSRSAAILTGGVQWGIQRFSVFGQASMMPAKSRFFFNDGTTYFLEGGIRYNIGSAIERGK